MDPLFGLVCFLAGLAFGAALARTPRTEPTATLRMEFGSLESHCPSCNNPMFWVNEDTDLPELRCSCCTTSIAFEETPDDDDR